MNSANSGDCIIGSKLQGDCKGNLPRNSNKFIVLPKYNTQGCVLEGFATCKIINQVTKLPTPNYLECLEKIRESGYHPKETINFEIKGTEISCEFQTQSKNKLIFKSIIALGILVRSFSKGGFYKKNETYMGSPKYQLK